MRIISLGTTFFSTYGTHTIKIEADQVEGEKGTFGIYINIKDTEFPDEFKKVGEVTNGHGTASLEVEVKPEVEVEYEYITIRVGIGLYDPFNYTNKFNVRLYLDDAKIGEATLDMRTILEVTGCFKKPSPEEGVVEEKPITEETKKERLVPIAIMGGLLALGLIKSGKIGPAKRAGY